MKRSFKVTFIYLLYLLPSTVYTQCDVYLNTDYNDIWPKYIEIINQVGSTYTLEYNICNPSSESWSLAVFDILIQDLSFNAVGPNPIITPFGDFTMFSGGWDSGLMIPSNSCHTIQFEIAGNGSLNTEDIKINVLAFNATFSTIYCGSSFLHICNSNISISGIIDEILFEESTDSILSDQVIVPDAIIVEYDATDYILLDIGFEVQNGATFKAFIDGCGGSF